MIGLLLLGQPAWGDDSPLRTRPVEGWGPYRLGQAVPRMQMGKFLPVRDIAEISAPSYEERFEAGRLIRTYRCIDGLETGRKTRVTAILTLHTVDGDLQSIQVMTDFTLVDDSNPPAAAAGQSEAAEADPDWDARKELASKAFRWLLDENFQHYLGHKAGPADVEQLIDGGGPCFVSSIAPEEGAGTLVLMLYPQHPLLQLSVDSAAWREIAATASSPVDAPAPKPLP